MLTSPTAPGSSSITLADRRHRLAVIIDDREWGARALQWALVEQGYATLRATTAGAGVALCAAADPDLVFIEQYLGGHTTTASAEPGGLALCRRLRHERAVCPSAPVIITTTDPLSRTALLSALDAGAWDACVVPVDAPLLLARCATWGAAKRQVDRYAQAALADPETESYNFRGLLRRAQELAAAGRRSASVAPTACIAFRMPSGTGASALHVREAWRAVGRAADTFARVGARDFDA